MSTDSEINSNEKKRKANKTNVCPLRQSIFPPPPLQKTPAKHSRSPDITVVFKVDRSPFDFLCTTAVWHKQKTRVEFNFRPDRGWFHGVADRYIVSWTKQTGSDVTKWKRRFHWAVAWRLWNSILTHLSKKMPHFVMVKIIFLFFLVNLPIKCHGFFWPFSIFEEKWRVGRKVLHSDEGNSLWKFFFFFNILLLYLFGFVAHWPRT